MNKVLAGDYKGCSINKGRGVAYINSTSKIVNIDKMSVERYELADKNTASKFSYTGAILGNVVFGPAGTVAGVGGKQRVSYQMAIYFRDGKSSLIEVDSKVHQLISNALFNLESFDYERALAKQRRNSAKRSLLLKRILLRIPVYLITVIILGLAMSAFYPSVDGVTQVGTVGAFIMLAFPVLFAVLISVLVIKKKPFPAREESAANLPRENLFPEDLPGESEPEGGQTK